MERFFKLSLRSTTVRTEFIAGMNAFFVYTVGIAFGLLSYIVISVFCGEIKKIKGASWVIALLFVAMLLLTH